MAIKIALAGNPNSGKTTLFNALTGASQYVGNWAGVTVEVTAGKLKGYDGVKLADLPGIYSLSPYTLEEVVARNYLLRERPDCILNIVDGTNLERNLYLTTQLLELGIPVVIAINMMDMVRKRGDKINLPELSRELGCPIVEISALKLEGIDEVATVAVAAASKEEALPMHNFSGKMEHALAHIEEALLHNLPEKEQRWYAVKLFERDPKVQEELSLTPEQIEHIESDIRAVEVALDDDAESIITNERYAYIDTLVQKYYKKKHAGKLSTSNKIDAVVTNRILALPIFVLAMYLVYTLSIGTVGEWSVGFMEHLFGDIVQPASKVFLENMEVAPWLVSLVSDGIVGGVGAVLGFVPQMLILFLLLSLLEDCGYMSRVAFIMDRLFRKFGLSGKSFIPMLVASGCGVPGVMASRTIEQERDRRMTIMTTCFIPCGAKMPIVGMIAGALFGGSAWVATSAYFIGVGAVIVSGIILKKTKPFRGEPAPFVMELPQYHAPVPMNILRTTWERGWSFVKKAGTVILSASIIIWILNSLSFEGGFHYISDSAGGASILEVIGGAIAVIFAPLGFGNWQASVATLLGLLAKEEVVGVFGSLSSMSDLDLAVHLFEGSGLRAFSFLIFNLLCAPCIAAMGAIRQEMNSAKWTFFAISYMCAFAYAVSLILYQLGTFFESGVFGIWTGVAILVLLGLCYLLFRKNKT